MSDIASELAKLHHLTGADFSRQVERIALHGEFHLLKDEANIYACGGEQDADYGNLLNAARKAVIHGYTVYILPNPKGIRTADFIFERKGTYRLYDLKTITGKSSVLNRLVESIGQSNHVLLNMATDYNPRQLAKDLTNYFNANPDGIEVLIFKKGKLMSITQRAVRGRNFVKTFIQNFKQ